MKALAVVFLLFAIAPVDIKTSQLRNGARYAYQAGDRNVTVSKENDVATINVMNGERVDVLTVREVDGRTVISHTSNGLEAPPPTRDRASIIVDGMNIESFIEGDNVDRSLRQSGMAAYYVCPKDRAILRVVNGPDEAMFKCPVDGTLMRPGAGPSRQFYLLH